MPGWRPAPLESRSHVPGLCSPQMPREARPSVACMGRVCLLPQMPQYSHPCPTLIIPVSWLCSCGEHTGGACLLASVCPLAEAGSVFLGLVFRRSRHPGPPSPPAYSGWQPWALQDLLPTCLGLSRSALPSSPSHPACAQCIREQFALGLRGPVQEEETERKVIV